MIKFDVHDLNFLKSILSYDPDTGLFRWEIAPRRNTPRGSIAGSVSKHGYRIIGFGGKEYRAARLAWAFRNGNWPPQIVDHINGNTLDDRISNLRLATYSQNSANTRRRSDQSVAKGVSWHKRGKFWTAQIVVQGTKHYLGSFKTSEEASHAYKNAAIKAFGEFARMS